MINTIPGRENVATSEFIMVTSADIIKLKFKDLKIEIEKRGLVLSGNNNNIQEILKKAMVDRTRVSYATVTSTEVRTSTTVTFVVAPRDFAVATH